MVSQISNFRFSYWHSKPCQGNSVNQQQCDFDLLQNSFKTAKLLERFYEKWRNNLFFFFLFLLTIEFSTAQANTDTYQPGGSANYLFSMLCLQNLLTNSTTHNTLFFCTWQKTLFQMDSSALTTRLSGPSFTTQQSVLAPEIPTALILFFPTNHTACTANC